MMSAISRFLGALLDDRQCVALLLACSDPVRLDARVLHQLQHLRGGNLAQAGHGAVAHRWLVRKRGVQLVEGDAQGLAPRRRQRRRRPPGPARYRLHILAIRGAELRRPENAALVELLHADLGALLEHEVVAFLGVQVVPRQLVRLLALERPQDVRAARDDVEHVVRARALHEDDARVLVRARPGHGALHRVVTEQLRARRQSCGCHLHLFAGGRRRQLVHHLAQPVQHQRLAFHGSEHRLEGHLPHHLLRRLRAAEDLALHPLHGLFDAARVQPGRV
mmetsp:Transcript_58527/g.164116  ORF Transcript_58527/g.164116 Transcript_58527/m.164116 type:complete len:278 (-) Transcript_58527:1314-2147(-)